MKVKVEMAPVNTMLKKLGVTPDGDVQMQATKMICDRMTRYMPFRTGAMATKLKFIKSPTEIDVVARYTKYQYYGHVMVNAKTGKGPMLIPGVGLRYKKDTQLKATNRNLQYDKTKNPEAGPFWDRKLMAAEGQKIAAEVQGYVNRRKK